MQSGFVQSDAGLLGLQRHRHLRRKAQGRRPARHRHPLSRDLPRGGTRDSASKTIRDLKGKRVSLDEPGSGTLVDARLILAAYGISEKDIKAEYKKPQQLADRLKDSALDAYFSVAGWPEGAVAALAATTEVALVPIEGPETEALLKQYSFFAADEIPDGAYKNVAGVKTVSVNAIWATSSKQPDDLIYNVTAALWNANTRKLLDRVMPRAARSGSKRQCGDSVFRSAWGRRSSTEKGPH